MRTTPREPDRQLMALAAASPLETPRRSGAARLRPGAAQPPAGSAAGQGRVTAALPAARRGRAPPPGSGAPQAKAAGLSDCREPCPRRAAPASWLCAVPHAAGCAKPASSGQAAACVKVSLRIPSIQEKSLPFRPSQLPRANCAPKLPCGKGGTAVRKCSAFALYFIHFTESQQYSMIALTFHTHTHTKSLFF